MLTDVEEAIVVAFCRHTLLPLDDVVGCLREGIPKLTRSALHRCLQRVPASLDCPETKSERPSAVAPLANVGYVYGLRWAEGKLYTFFGHRPPYKADEPAR